MKTIIETTIKNDTNKDETTWSVVLDMDELTKVAATRGAQGANEALDGFVKKYVGQFKEKFGAAINK
jgi:hypothetical protein